MLAVELDFHDEADSPKVDEETEALFPGVDADEEAVRRSEAFPAPEVIGIVGGVAPSGWRLDRFPVAGKPGQFRFHCAPAWLLRPRDSRLKFGLD